MAKKVDATEELMVQYAWKMAITGEDQRINADADCDGWTALDIAAQYGWAAATSAILELNADFDKAMDMLLLLCT